MFRLRLLTPAVLKIRLQSWGVLNGNMKIWAGLDLGWSHAIGERGMGITVPVEAPSNCGEDLRKFRQAMCQRNSLKDRRSILSWGTGSGPALAMAMGTGKAELMGATVMGAWTALGKADGSSTFANVRSQMGGGARIVFLSRIIWKAFTTDWKNTSSMCPIPNLSASCDPLTKAERKAVSLQPWWPLRCYE